MGENERQDELQTSDWLISQFYPYLQPVCTWKNYMYLFLSISCAITNVDSLNVSSSKKRRNNNGGQELKPQIFVSLDFRNHLAFVSNLGSQLQPPLHELALLE